MKSCFMVVAFLGLAGMAVAQGVAGKADPADFLFPRDRLASQASHPFKLVGRVMDESRPRWDEFKDTIAAFPDTSSCLLPEERDKDVQNLLAFDWKAMRYLTEIDICVWRIATTLDDIGLMRDWLALQGFSGSYNTQSCDNAVRTPITSVRSSFCGTGGVMSAEAFDEKSAVFDSIPFLTRWIWRRVAQRAGVTVNYSFEMDVNSVSATVISQ